MAPPPAVKWSDCYAPAIHAGSKEWPLNEQPFPCRPSIPAKLNVALAPHTHILHVRIENLVLAPGHVATTRRRIALLLMYRKIKNSFAASTALLPASGSVTLIYDECCRFRSDCIMQLSPASLQQNLAQRRLTRIPPCRESRCESTY